MSASARPVITSNPPDIRYGSSFGVEATLSGGRLEGNIQIALSNPGFHTHGVAMGQRMIMMSFVAAADGNLLTVTSPSNPSVMPPGVHLLFVTHNGIPSVGTWIELGS